jgi:hypothetical protein
MFNYCVIILSNIFIKITHMDELRNAYGILVRKPGGKRPLRKKI